MGHNIIAAVDLFSKTGPRAWKIAVVVAFIAATIAGEVNRKGRAKGSLVLCILLYLLTAVLAAIAFFQGALGAVAFVLIVLIAIIATIISVLPTHTSTTSSKHGRDTSGD